MTNPSADRFEGVLPLHPDHLHWLILGALMAMLAALKLEIAIPIAIFLLLFLLAAKDEYLLLAIMVFGVICSMPALEMVSELMEIRIFGSTSINCFGAIRTAFAFILTARISLLIYADWGLVRLNRMYLFVAIYAIFSLGWVQSNAIAEALRRLVHLLLSLGCFYLGAIVGTRKDKTLLLLKRIAMLGFILSASSLLIMNTVSEHSDSGIDDSWGRDSRLIGITSSPNVLAGSLTVFVSISLAFLAVTGVPRKLRNISWVVLVSSSICLLLTMSRSGWVGAGLAIIFIMILKRRWLYLVLFAGGGLVLLLYSSMGHKFLGDWRSILEGADLAIVSGYQNAFGRLELWRLAMQELVTPWSILLGRGAGSTQYWVSPLPARGLHSEFLENWLDLGAIGTCFLLSGIWRSLKRGFHLFSTASDAVGKAVGLAAVVAIVATLPRFVWDFVFNQLVGWLFLTVCGLACGADRWAAKHGGARQRKACT